MNDPANERWQRRTNRTQTGDEATDNNGEDDVKDDDDPNNKYSAIILS